MSMIEKALMCMFCTIGDDVVEFPNMMELKKHEMMGHTTRWERDLPVDPRGEHPSATELKEKKNTQADKAPVATAPQPEPEHSLPLLPMKLKYKWEGQCPNCRDDVKTIEVEVGEHSLIIAYCVRCDNKLQQQKVIPIPLQDRTAKELPESSDNSFERHIKPTKKS
jgi:hypothetical protein